MIMCRRTVRVPADQEERFLDWIDANAELRRQHGILFEVARSRSPRQNPPTAARPDDPDTIDDAKFVVVTAWPDHDTFDAWIDTPDRDRLTASPQHQAVESRPLTRFDVLGGYLAASTLSTIETRGARE